MPAPTRSRRSAGKGVAASSPSAGSAESVEPRTSGMDGDATGITRSTADAHDTADAQGTADARRTPTGRTDGPAVKGGRMQEPDPRIVRTREVVLAAAAELLVEDGFERITIEAIADRSGVARSTIYRNWPDRADLLVGAFEQLCSFPDPPDTGSLAGDLHRIGTDLCVGLRGSAWGRVVPSLVGAVAHDPELREAQQRFAGRRRAIVATVFERAMARGEVRSDLAGETLAEVFASRFFHRHLMSQGVLDDAFVAEQVDIALRLAGATSPPAVD